jgi:hypothetical protein
MVILSSLLGSQPDALFEPPDDMAMTAEPGRRSAPRRPLRRHPGGDRPTARRCPGGRRSQVAPPRASARMPQTGATSALLPPGSAARACQPRRKRSRCTSRTSNGVAAGQRRSPASSRRSPSTTARWTHPTPTAHDVVRAVVRGTRRQLGEAQPQKKTALELDALRSLILNIPGGSSLANRHGLPMRLRKRQQSARSSRSAGRA